MADDGEESWLYGENGAAIEQLNAEHRQYFADKIDDGPPGIEQGSERESMDDIPAPPGVSDEKDNQAEEDGQLNASVTESEPPLPETNGDVEEKEEGERDDDSKEDDDEDDDDDDDDDNINIVIGDIRTAPSSYSALNIKRGGLVSSVRGADKTKPAGKFSVEDFEQIGTINSVPVHEYNLDTLEEKPWRKPGADITDYFNYGFDEDTWRAYCERQKRYRLQESGVGLATLSSNATSTGTTNILVPTNNFVPQQKTTIDTAVPPPPRPHVHTEQKYNAPASVIPVMTADRREYSRKHLGDMSAPPPSIPPPVVPPPQYGVPPPPAGYPPPPPPREYSGNYFQPPEVDSYYLHNSYEPTQDSQWNQAGWVPPVNVKNIPPPGTTPVDIKSEENLPPGTVQVKKEPADGASSSSREREKDRYRERSQRHRSRSRSHERRSRKRKSKSRSPSHRSHKKKKSKKSERSRDRSRDRSREKDSS